MPGYRPATRRRAGGARTGSGLPKKKAGSRLGGAKRVRRRKKAGGPLGDFAGKVVNKVVNAAGKVVGAVVGGVYRAGKTAGKAAVRAAKGGATRTRKRKAGMQLGGAKPKRKRRANPWLAHVKKTMAANKGMAFKAVLKKAKASYKKK